ncbi:hypothetical protein TNCV_4129461 [Trichonephila clavipes]|nr:hypothetical protein TNCV_4129461 [Trichonephila clavipes]
MRPIVKGGRESDIRQGQRDASLERLWSFCFFPEVEAAEKAHPRLGRTEKETLFERANGEGEGERMFKHSSRDGRQNGKKKQRRVSQCLDVTGAKKILICLSKPQKEMKTKEDTKSLQNSPSSLRSPQTSVRCVELNIILPTASRFVFSSSVSVSLPHSLL